MLNNFVDFVLFQKNTTMICSRFETCCKVEPGPPPSVRRETWDRTGIGVLELSSELWRIARCELPSKPRVYTGGSGQMGEEKQKIIWKAGEEVTKWILRVDTYSTVQK